MAEPFVNERLLPQLRVREGRHQFVLTGEIDDLFFVDALHGLMSLEDALRFYARREGFEVVLFLDKNISPVFLEPAMENIFEQVVRGVSRDPQAGDRAARVFQPRARRATPGSGAPAEEAAPAAGAAADRTSNKAGAQPAVSPVPAGPSQAQDAARDARQAAASAEQTTLDQITRLLKSSCKSLVVFRQPETMWPLNSAKESDLRKLESIVGWCKVTQGHPRSLSILIVNRKRLDEFRCYADAWGDRADYTTEVELPNPDRRELEAFLRRVMCRHGCWGDANRLAKAAHGQRLNLYNLSHTVADYLRDRVGSRSLDGLFDEVKQAVTLEDVLAQLNDMTGLADVKSHIHRLVQVALAEQQQRRLGRRISPRSYHMFFVGNPGTGKTVVARLVAKLFWAAELRTSHVCEEISAQDVISAFNEGDTIQNMKAAISRAMGGVLFIDEVYLLAENEWGRKALQTLMKEMEDHRDNLTVIMAGYEEKLPELFDVNPGFKSRVSETVRFPDYTTDEMLAIFAALCRKDGLTPAEAAQSKLRRYVESFNRMGGLGNARGVRDLFEKTAARLLALAPGDTEISAEMLPDPICFREAEARALLEEVNREFIGLRRVKDFLQELFLRQRSAEAKGSQTPEHNNCLFLGNPGTGKTSIARRMGQLCYYMGLTSERDRLIEVDPIHDLTSPYQGGYAGKVRTCFDRARGGVLFVDEAYQLADDPQGKEALNQIVKLLTEPRYRNLVAVLAGYPDEMQALYKLNPGLKRRFPHEVHFDDFQVDDLCTIFYQCMERDRHRVADNEQEVFRTRARSELGRLSRQRHFGNAGAVQNFYEKVKANQERRLASEPQADRFVLRAADISQDAAELEDLDGILDDDPGPLRR